MEIGLSPTNVDVLLSTSSPAASTALLGMVHGSHGSLGTGAVTTDVGESATGALDVELPHPATRTITAATPATVHRVLLTSVRRIEHRVGSTDHNNLTPLLTTARPRSLQSKGAQSSKKV
nr:hypothetical protein [Rhodococcus sp. 06-235-1A]